MRTVHWTDRSVYRITEIVFRQHGLYESFDIARAVGRDLRDMPVNISITNGPVKAPHGLIYWLFEQAEQDDIDEHVLLEDLRVYCMIDIPGAPTAVYKLGA